MAITEAVSSGIFTFDHPPIKKIEKDRLRFFYPVKDSDGIASYLKFKLRHHVILQFFLQQGIKRFSVTQDSSLKISPVF